MKRKLIISMLGMLLGAGCQEYEMKEYTLMGRVNFIAVDEYGMEYTDPEKMVYEVDFGKIYPEQDTLKITVRAQGNIADHDRKISFKFVEENCGIDIPNLTGYVLPAGEYQHTFTLLVNKPAVADTLFEGQLTFDYENSDFLAGLDEQQYYTIQCGDMFDPAIYEKAQEWWAFTADYFGEYSKMKVKFITLSLNWTANTWENAWMNLSGYYKQATEALKEYRTAPNNYPLLDENTKEWISFPFDPDIIWAAESGWEWVQQFFGVMSDTKIQFITETLGWTVEEWSLSFAFATADTQKQLIEAYEAYKAAGGEPLIDENTGEEITFTWEASIDIDQEIVDAAQMWWSEEMLGAFSQAKVAFITNEMGWTLDKWNNEGYLLWDPSFLQEVQDALEFYKANGGAPYIDENTGEEISFGSASGLDPNIIAAAQMLWDIDFAQFFGEYSEAKVRFVTEVMGWTIDTWNNPWGIIYKTGFLQEAHDALENYKNSGGEPYIDENTGEWIEFAPLP